MVQIDTPASMDSFRTFVMVSTCSSFAPQSYADDTEVFQSVRKILVLYTLKLQIK